MKDNKFLATARNYELLFHPGGGGAMFHKLAPTKEQSWYLFIQRKSWQQLLTDSSQQLEAK